MIARVAKEFGVLPSVVARDLDNDPERLSLEVIPLLRYAEVHGAYRRADAAELKRIRSGPLADVLTQVEATEFEMAEREMAAAAAEVED